MCGNATLRAGLVSCVHHQDPPGPSQIPSDLGPWTGDDVQRKNLFSSKAGKKSILSRALHRAPPQWTDPRPRMSRLNLARTRMARIRVSMIWPNLAKCVFALVGCVLLFRGCCVQDCWGVFNILQCFNIFGSVQHREPSARPALRWTPLHGGPLGPLGFAQNNPRQGILDGPRP